MVCSSALVLIGSDPNTPGGISGMFSPRVLAIVMQIADHQVYGRAAINHSA